MALSPFAQALLPKAIPFKKARDIQPLIDRLHHKKIVMLGESSHGTHEFYEWRRLISQELIEGHGFRFIAVEGDWPPCDQVNCYIKGQKEGKTREVLKHFSRWPTWIWSNTEMVSVVDWLKGHNAGFYGLDVYSLFESVDEVIKQLFSIDTSLAQKAANAYGCFEKFNRDEMRYAQDLFTSPQGCRPAVDQLLQELKGIKLEGSQAMDNALFDAIQNALVVKNAEAYYWAMMTGSDNSWNVRDRHMLETLESLLSHYGPETKAIIWAHNTHVGDYRATEMALNGEINLGGLAREKFGEENVALVGFGTNSGTVTASPAWDGPALTMPVPEGRPRSIEAEMHSIVSEVSSENFYFMFDPQDRFTYLGEEIRGHRAIGVVYDPEREFQGNYVPTSLAKRYDCFVYLDKTKAVTPLKVTFDRHKFPDTYPFANQG